MVCSLPAVRAIWTIMRHDGSNGRAAGSTNADAVSDAVAESGTLSDADAGHDESIRRELQRSLRITVYAAASDALSAGSGTCDNMATNDRGPWALALAKSLGSSAPDHDGPANPVCHVGARNADAFDAEFYDGLWLR